MPLYLTRTHLADGRRYALRMAGRAGGAVLASGVMFVDSCTLSRNRAFLGPAISNTVSLTISSTEFDDNTLYCDEEEFLDWANVSGDHDYGDGSRGTFRELLGTLSDGEIMALPNRLIRSKVFNWLRSTPLYPS